MNAKIAFLSSIAAFILLGGLLIWNPLDRRPEVATTQPSTQPAAPGEPLLLYCAAGIRKPVAAAAEQYEREYGQRVQIQYGGSQTLLANIQLSKTGDLYLPADDSYFAMAAQHDLLAETTPLAAMRPVLAVRQGNPKNVRSLADLLNVRVGLADPDAAAVGRMTRDVLRQAGKWDAIAQHAVVTVPTVNEIGTAINLGTIDAGFVWDATVKQMPGLTALELPELAGQMANIGVGVLKSSRQPTAALKFLRYLSARDKGLPLFAAEGFTPVDGDYWAEEPRVVLYGGSMLRPAIEDTIAEFEAREGCRVDRVYNGCGILVGQMKIGQRPDAYFACDKAFMTQVKDLFLDDTDVSINQLVILVHKGNPHNIRVLADLGKPGLKLGIGHEQQCAMGAITAETFRQTGTSVLTRKNVVVESPTGDLLVNQMLTGSLDAAIVYVSNAAGHADRLEAIKIDVACALAVQPVAVGRESKHKQLMARLKQRILTAESRERFEAFGFRWKQ